jgi:4-carboxymuconolactone decarboxylase
MALSVSEKGRAVRSKLLGADFAKQLDKTVYTDPMMEKFAEVARQIAFGTVWVRPGLDLKTRTMITLVSDTTTGRTPELKLHIRMARNQGWTENEIAEAMIHLTAYVGLPLIREALLTAKEVFAELRTEAKPKATRAKKK